MNKPTFRIVNGDSLEELPKLAADGVKVDAVLTSPPYAMQRAAQYGGIREKDYPAWSVAWMRAAGLLLTPAGSAVINIREHVHGGVISDYVLRSRIAQRDSGWMENDELIWFKPNAPPVGHPKRPRRSWERLLWFSKTPRPYCDPKANGRESERVGISASISVHGWANAPTKEHASGVARCPDVVTVPLTSEQSSIHPAAFPVALARWLVRLFVPEGGTVLDPFAGSMTVGVAAAAEGRNFVGCELKSDLFEKGELRLRRAHLEAVEAPRPARGTLAPTPLFPEEAEAGSLFE